MSVMTSDKNTRETDIMKRSIGWFAVIISLNGCVELRPTAQIASFVAAPQVIDVADKDIIRIVTPFPEPRVVTTSDAEITRSQHVLYVLPSNEANLSMFVTDAENEANSINLTLRPRTGGTREIDVAALGSATVRAAGLKKESQPPAVRPAGSKQRASAAPKAAKKDQSDGLQCRLCRNKDDEGSYSGSSW